MTVLILAQDADAPTDAVVAELTRRGVPVFRADTSWFPSRLVIDAYLDTELGLGGRWRGTLSTERRCVELGEIRSIWYRDPAAFAFAETLTDVEEGECYDPHARRRNGVASASGPAGR